MPALLLDLDGVLYVGERPIEGAGATIRWLREAGIAHLFLTNTTSRPRADLVQKLAALGMEVEARAILTPAVAASQWLRQNVSAPVALFVPEATRTEFAGLPLLDEQAEEGAGAVVLGDLAERWDFATLNRAFRLLMGVPRPLLVALGMTRYWRTAAGLQLDVAPFVVALEHAVGCQARIMGKPAAAFFQAAVDRLGVNAAETVMVGDDIQGDVGAAQQAGIRALLVRTGKFHPTDLELGITPDAVLNSIADLPAWWTREGAPADT